MLQCDNEMPKAISFFNKAFLSNCLLQHTFIFMDGEITDFVCLEGFLSRFIIMWNSVQKQCVIRLQTYRAFSCTSCQTTHLRSQTSYCCNNLPLTLKQTSSILLHLKVHRRLLLPLQYFHFNLKECSLNFRNCHLAAMVPCFCFQQKLNESWQRWLRKA